MLGELGHDRLVRDLAQRLDGRHAHVRVVVLEQLLDGPERLGHLELRQRRGRALAHPLVVALERRDERVDGLLFPVRAQGPDRLGLEAVGLVLRGADEHGHELGIADVAHGAQERPAHVLGLLLLVAVQDRLDDVLAGELSQRAGHVDAHVLALVVQRPYEVLLGARVVRLREDGDAGLPQTLLLRAEQLHARVEGQRAVAAHGVLVAPAVVDVRVLEELDHLGQRVLVRDPPQRVGRVTAHVLLDVLLGDLEERLRRLRIAQGPQRHAHLGAHGLVLVAQEHDERVHGLDVADDPEGLGRVAADRGLVAVQQRQHVVEHVELASPAQRHHGDGPQVLARLVPPQPLHDVDGVAVAHVRQLRQGLGRGRGDLRVGIVEQRLVGPEHALGAEAAQRADGLDAQRGVLLVLEDVEQVRHHVEDAHVAGPRHRVLAVRRVAGRVLDDGHDLLVVLGAPAPLLERAVLVLLALPDLLVVGRLRRRGRRAAGCERSRHECEAHGQGHDAVFHEIPPGRPPGEDRRFHHLSPDHPESSTGQVTMDISPGSGASTWAGP